MSVFPQVARLGGMALNLIFPKRCIGCGQEGDFICPSCRSSLPRIMPPFCPRCGSPQASGIICPSCVNWQARIEGIRSPFRFDGVVRQAVHQLKYRGLTALAAPLAGFINEYLANNPMPSDVLVPVPLHPKRLRERGYNQSALLARELGRLAGLPVSHGCLVRQSYTTPQVGTSSVAQRRSNIAGAFVCADRKLEGRQVLLIDDVSTSGATLDACAAALKAAGAVSVWGLVLAKEI